MSASISANLCPILGRTSDVGSTAVKGRGASAVPFRDVALARTCRSDTPVCVRLDANIQDRRSRSDMLFVTHRDRRKVPFLGAVALEALRWHAWSVMSFVIEVRSDEVMLLGGKCPSLRITGIAINLIFR